jgi:hypothetical protein
MSQRLAPKVGIAASLAALATVAYPYFVAPGSAVAVYYGTVAVPIDLLTVLFSLVTVVAFGSGLNGRTDPQTVAGVTLVLGGFVALLALWWATQTPPDPLVETARMDALRYHRWVVVGFALVVTASAAWYARSVL